MNTTTIDLEEEAREIRNEKLPAVTDAIQELLEEFEAEYGTYSEVPADEERAYEKLEDKRVELEGRASALERVVDEWGGSEIVIQELSTGALAEIQDSVAEKSFEFDPEAGEVRGGTPKSGFGMIETLRKSIVEQPDGAPVTVDSRTGEEVPAPEDYPESVGMYLFEKVNSFNTVGDTEMGNSSLRERMEN